MPVAVGANWMMPHPHLHPQFQHSDQPHVAQDAQIPARNEVELSRETLITVLTYFSTILPSEFGHTAIRLIVHGGACMLLHPGLHSLAQQQQQTQSYSQGGDIVPRRTTTRDVDIIQRSFVTEYRALGIPDPAVRLQRCIRATARHFDLGADWMNSDADIALPMAIDATTARQYDPIYTSSVQPNNIHIHTVFTSPNGLLTLISVTPFWAVALKLVRYTKWDPGDICLLLRNGTHTVGTKWSPERVEEWLLKLCWPMGYANYTPQKMQDMRAKIAHAVQCLPDNEKHANSSTARATSPPAARSNSMPVPTHAPFMVVPPAAAAGPTPPPWLDPSRSLSGQWGSSLPPSGHPSPFRHSLHSLDDSIRLNGKVEEFDRSIALMLGTQTNVNPRPRHGHVAAETEQHQRKMWRKQDKKKKHRVRTASRRIKYMLGWNDPDDSDEDRNWHGQEDESSSDSESDSEPDHGHEDEHPHPALSRKPVLHDSYRHSRTPSPDSWGSTTQFPALPNERYRGSQGTPSDSGWGSASNSVIHFPRSHEGSPHHLTSEVFQQSSLTPPFPHHHHMLPEADHPTLDSHYHRQLLHPPPLQQKQQHLHPPPLLPSKHRLHSQHSLKDLNLLGLSI